MQPIVDRDRDWIESRTTATLRGLVDDAPMLEVESFRLPCGALVIDCGVDVRGSWEAGRRMAVLAHGGAMDARLEVASLDGLLLPELVGDSWRPALTAGFLQVSFPLDEIDPAVRVSGPIRAAVDRQVDARRVRAGDANPWGAAVVETDRLPDDKVAFAIARRAGLSPDALTLVVAPAATPAGVAQLAGRLNECVLFTLERCLGVDPACAVSVVGAVPLAPCGGPEALVVTQDDMIHYAGRATLLLDAPSTCDLQALADGLVYRSAPSYGVLFSELLRAAGGVFEAVAGLDDLNKVAEITVVDRRRGRIASAGASDVAFVAAALVGRREERHGERDGRDR